LALLRSDCVVRSVAVLHRHPWSTSAPSVSKTRSNDALSTSPLCAAIALRVECGACDLLLIGDELKQKDRAHGVESTAGRSGRRGAERRVCGPDDNALMFSRNLHYFSKTTQSKILPCNTSRNVRNHHRYKRLLRCSAAPHKTDITESQRSRKTSGQLRAQRKPRDNHKLMPPRVGNQQAERLAEQRQPSRISSATFCRSACCAESNLCLSFGMSCAALFG